MRIPIWLPRTHYGLLATLVSIATIAAILWMWAGTAITAAANAPVGTAAYGSGEQGLLAIGIAAVVAGSWMGMRLERRHLRRIGHR